MKYNLFIFSLILTINQLTSQSILKENLTKIEVNYWDYAKTAVQSRGSYFKNQLGETTNQHGKWEYFNKSGNLVEERNFYNGKLHGAVLLFYPNKSLKQEGYFKTEKQDSIYREWNEIGILTVEGSFKDDKPVGIWKYYYENGNKRSEVEYIDTIVKIQSFWLNDSLNTQTLTNGNGYKVDFYPNGIIKEKYTYKNFLIDGKFEENSFQGFPLVTGFYDQGIKIGEWKFYYYTGQLEKINNFQSNKLHGKYSYYYDNGQVKTEGNFDNGLKNGIWTWYTNQGNKDMEGTFKEGKQHGKWTYWYPTGEVSYYAHYDMDLKTGLWEYYYKDGSKFKKVNFQNDQKHGLSQTWYENGTLLMEGEYKNGKENGVWTNYWENSNIKNRTTFKNGAIHGNWESYYPSGKMSLKGTYKNGLKDKEWIDFFENGYPKELNTYRVITTKNSTKYGPFKGQKYKETIPHGKFMSFSDRDFKINQEGNFTNGKKDGVWKMYHPGGKIIANSSEYKNGKLNGSMKEYDRKGKIVSEANFKDGLKHGSIKVYDAKGKIRKEINYENGTVITPGGKTQFSPSTK